MSVAGVGQIATMANIRSFTRVFGLSLNVGLALAAAVTTDATAQQDQVAAFYSGRTEGHRILGGHRPEGRFGHRHHQSS
jgi:hypothetical protein